MPLYEHVETTDTGERVTQRVRPAEDSKNADQLAAKAADDKSGWREVDETAPTPEKPSQPGSGADAKPGVSGKQLTPEKTGA